MIGRKWHRELPGDSYSHVVDVPMDPGYVPPTLSLNPPAGAEPPAHHPQLLYTGRYGYWCQCACGTWRSGHYRAVTGAHIEFGRHLLDARRATTHGRS